MKKILILLFILISSLSQATNYTVGTGGSYTSITQVNAAWLAGTFNAGDSILFKRGETFNGTLTVSESGTIGNPIVVGAWGASNLAKPIITGFSTVTGWTSEGNGIYSKVIAGQSTPNMVTVNGVNTAKGRYPNANATWGGYLNIDSHVLNTSLTISELNSAVTNWTGAEVVLKTWRWVIDRGTITNHSGSTLTYTGGVSEAKDGYGVFIQNDIRTFDIVGEWAYRDGRLYMYFGANNPDGYTVKMSVLDKNLYSTQGYITLSNLSFEGANVYGIQQSGGSNFTVLDCNIDYIGTTGLYVASNNDAIINRCRFTNINDNAFYSSVACDNTYFGYNTVRNCATIPGATGSGDLHGFGIYMYGNNETVEYNTIDVMGYLGMYVSGNNMLVRYNSVDSTCLVKDDGGGIYINGYAQTTMSNRIIEYNIVTNAVGNGDGTTSAAPQAYGIYPDGYANNMIIRNNTVSKCLTAGIFLGIYNHDVSILNNTVIDNPINLSHSEGDAIANNNIVNGNIFATTTTDDLVSLSMNTRPLSSFGTWSGNYYIKPFDDKAILNVNYSYDLREDFEGLSINGFTDYDATPHTIPVTITPYITNSLIGTNKFPNGAFTSNITGAAFSYTGTGTLTWDNTNKISGGSAKVSYTVLSTIRGHSQVKLSVGALNANSKYILKYDVLGSSLNKMVRVFLKYGLVYYTDRFKYQPYTTSVTHVEMLLEPNSAAAIAELFFEFQDVDGTVYLDNVEFHEAVVAKANPSNYILFDYNSTQSNKTIIFTGRYKDVTGSSFVASKVITPFTSTVLFKDTTYIDNPIVLPTCDLLSGSTVISNMITISANAVFDGGGTIIERGIVYAQTTAPTTANSKVVNGSGLGVYLTTTPILSSGATYYIRAYAINEAGTAYSNQVTITLPYAILYNSEKEVIEGGKTVIY